LKFNLSGDAFTGYNWGTPSGSRQGSQRTGRNYSETARSNVELKQLEYQKKTDEKLEQIFEYISDHEESNQKIFFCFRVLKR
jgi:hypothetical protein